METFAERIARLRAEKSKEKKWAQADVAAALGISRGHLAKMERGTAMPSYEILCALADFYDVSLDYLRTGAASLEQTRGVLHCPEEIALIRNWRAMEGNDKAAVSRLLTQLAVAAFEKRARA